MSLCIDVSVLLLLFIEEQPGQGLGKLPQVQTQATKEMFFLVLWGRTQLWDVLEGQLRPKSHQFLASFVCEWNDNRSLWTDSKCWWKGLAEEWTQQQKQHVLHLTWHAYLYPGQSGILIPQAGAAMISYLLTEVNSFSSVSQLKQSLTRESERWSPFGQSSGCIISGVDTSTISSTRGKLSAEVDSFYSTCSTSSYLMFPFSSPVYFNIWYSRSRNLAWHIYCLHSM